MKIGIKQFSNKFDNYKDYLIEYWEKQKYDYIELYVAPNQLDNLPLWYELKNKYGINYTIHAPHFSQGVNLADKNLFDHNKNVYQEVIKTAVGGAAGVIHQVESAVTDCQPNDNVEALRIFMLNKRVECRPLWKPMHKQPIYCNDSKALCYGSLVNGREYCVVEGPNMVAFVNGISEELFKIGVCLPAGPMVTDDDVRYIVDCIRDAIER